MKKSKVTMPEISRDFEQQYCINMGEILKAQGVMSI
jgi:hypothetical protein